jgi:predicted dehydrogenase
MIAFAGNGVLPNVKYFAEKVDVVSIADVVVERAHDAGDKFGIPERYSSLDDMLRESDIDAVVNLTPIPDHAETSLKIVEAGKHLAVEKPIATTIAEADAIIAAAEAAQVTVVCSPPDALYGQYREARRLIDEGVIGKVAFARVQSSHAGPGGSTLAWPMDPSWFYLEGSGPLFDMGVYGLHEITTLLGPAKRVVAFSGITEPTRVVRNGPYAGLEMPVTADDNSLFLLDFGGATYAVVDGTFNVHASKAPKVEVYGRKGVLTMYKDGPRLLELYRADAAPLVDGWIEPTRWPEAQNARSELLRRAILVDHLADCVASGSKPVLSAEHARHVLEIMLAVKTSAVEARVVELETTF